MTDGSSHYAEVVSRKDACRSCIMLEERPYMDQFTALGVQTVRANQDGAVIVDIPLDAVGAFVDLYCHLMRPGRWNEYVGPQTGFYFKMTDGEVRHIILNEHNAPLINRTIKEFIPSWSLEQNLWDWLAQVDIYADWLAE